MENGEKSDMTAWIQRCVISWTTREISLWLYCVYSWQFKRFSPVFFVSKTKLNLKRNVTTWLKLYYFLQGLWRLSRMWIEISIETNMNHTCNSNEDCECKANQEYHEDQDKMSFWQGVEPHGSQSVIRTRTLEILQISQTRSVFSSKLLASSMSFSCACVNTSSFRARSASATTLQQMVSNRQLVLTRTNNLHIMKPPHAVSLTKC